MEPSIDKEFGVPIEETLKIRHPCNMIVVVSSNTGKTTRVLSMLKHLKDCFYNIPENGLECIFIHGLYQKIFEEHPHIRFYEGWDSEETSQENLKTKRHCAIVIDDAYVGCDQEFLRYLFCSLMHHQS